MFPQLTSPHLHFGVRIGVGCERGMTIVVDVVAVVVVVGSGFGFVVGGINVGVPMGQDQVQGWGKVGEWAGGEFSQLLAPFQALKGTLGE